MPRVAVCIATFKRASWLRDSLTSVAAVTTSGSPVDLAVIVVDNDRRESARNIAAEAASTSAWPIHYCVEPERGLSHARNRAVREARSRGAEFVAFVDDDEIVATDWLQELLAVQRAHEADVVTGPVLPQYEIGVPRWVVAGGFFERPRYPTGTRLDWARSGNCLIRGSLLDGPEAPFDPRFALSGGEDTHFFRRVHAGGARIVWADAAVLFERVPVARGRVGWLVRRAYAGASSFTVSERLDGHPAATWVARTVVRGAGRALEGALMLGPGLLRGRIGATRALQRLSVGLGALAGLVGRLPEPYRGGDEP